MRYYPCRRAFYESTCARIVESGAYVRHHILDSDGLAEITLDLPLGEYSGEWIETKTGTSEPLETFRHDAKEKTLRSRAFRNGIALRLQRIKSKDSEP